MLSLVSDSPAPFPINSISQTVNPPTSSLASLFSSNVIGNAVSLGRLPIGINYICRKGYRKDFTPVGSIGNVLLTPADAAGAVQFGRTIIGMGLSSYLSGVISLLYLTAYIAIALDSTMTICITKDVLRKRQAVLDLSNSITQIALAALALARYTHVLVLALAVVGSLCGGLSFLHRYRYEREFVPLQPSLPIYTGRDNLTKISSR